LTAKTFTETVKDVLVLLTGSSDIRWRISRSKAFSIEIFANVSAAFGRRERKRYTNFEYFLKKGFLKVK